jgi:5'-nucleotidase
MRILISNDDGIFSPGLIALAEVASLFGEVVIFAPDFEPLDMPSPSAARYNTIG